MSELETQLDPGRIDLVTLDESKDVYKLIVAASHITEMEAADEDSLRQKQANYIAVARSGGLQQQYPELSTMGCMIQVDVAPNGPPALRQIASAFEAEAALNGITVSICEID